MCCSPNRIDLLRFVSLNRIGLLLFIFLNRTWLHAASNFPFQLIWIIGN
uniref:Uncharacterized protein n=1 Tax=Arundo donax TaxID=35708 RepID=A0A0A9G4D3_ARUDO